MKKYKLFAYEVETDTGDIECIDKIILDSKEALNHIVNKVKEEHDKCVLKPFQKILVRDRDDQKWRPAFYERYSGGGDHPFRVIDEMVFRQAIPYEGNEDLLGTTNGLPNY